eukprot:2228923-Amphidinium_carterae.1
MQCVMWCLRCGSSRSEAFTLPRLQSLKGKCRSCPCTPRLCCRRCSIRTALLSLLISKGPTLMVKAFVPRTVGLLSSTQYFHKFHSFARQAYICQSVATTAKE